MDSYCFCQSEEKFYVVGQIIRIVAGNKKTVKDKALTLSISEKK
jgi:hypothetical protein